MPQETDSATATSIEQPDLTAAAAAVETAGSVVEGAFKHLAAEGDVDADQVVAYDLAHAASAVENARAVLDYGEKGDDEARIACAFVADVVHEVATKLMGREREWGAEPGALDPALAFAGSYRSPEFLADLCGTQGPRHLDEDFVMVQDTFRRFAEERIRPIAEEIHRHNEDIPEEIIEGLAEIGTFGVSIPEEFDGFAAEGEGEYLSMVAATEELSRGSLGVGGSLITRPEILARALLAGGTEEQKKEWLPKMASGELMVGIAVTEPDFGSDVASMRTTATRDGDGWRINGLKTWCTFGARADVYMLLARTDPDRSAGHKGLSLFIVPKERGSGHGFELTQEEGGKMEGAAIDTIGYRGMHSYEVSFDNWYVPAENVIGGEEGLGRGFYMQMAGFENGRIQTAARAVGVMQAAYEGAYDYANERSVFGKPIIDYQLTRAKLARMAVIIQASRQFAYRVARLMAQGEGAMEASMVKAYVCRVAEWVTREAMQIHGGMGYAEEFPVSRYYVDARVLSIFEGADEVLALKVIARRPAR
ncbi:MAG TPA: acyl-CoA dehydrogenase family protein [Solirubrobacterales bacterium]|nr:acyl-CoA dehydrogenase family protein [Solirubrobacterales bacterium]